MGRKLGALSPLWGRRAGFPSNTISLQSGPTFVLSGILIHRAIWPQQIWTKIGGCAALRERDLGPHLRQCGQDRGIPECHVSSSSDQPFGHNTPTLQTGQDRTGRQRSDSISEPGPFYKRSLKYRALEGSMPSCIIRYDTIRFER